MSLRAPIVVYPSRGNVLVTGPAIEPVNVYEMKDYLRITDTSEDDLIQGMIADARAEIEEVSGLALVNQQWRLTLDRWPGRQEQWWDGVRDGSIAEIYGPQRAAYVALPRYPLVQINSVTVFDEASNSSVVSVANTFDVDTQQRPGRLGLKVGATWPIALRPTNAIQIVYTAGYGTTADSVPGPIKRAIRSMAAYLYSHRGDGCDVSEAMVKSGAQAIVGRYKVVQI